MVVRHMNDFADAPRLGDQLNMNASIRYASNSVYKSMLIPRQKKAFGYVVLPICISDVEIWNENSQHPRNR